MLGKYARLFALIALITVFNTTSLSANAVEIAGQKFDESVKLADTVLKLNGAGIRYKAIFKVYAAGLYLKDAKYTTADVLASAGPRRVTIIMLREVSSEEFGRGFMAGIQQNTDKQEKSTFTAQFLRLGELFSSIPEAKKGDTLTVDWIPNVGTVIAFNGKKLGDPYPDMHFYNAILRIWLGEKPVDNSLKRAMLAENGEDRTR